MPEQGLAYLRSADRVDLSLRWRKYKRRR